MNGRSSRAISRTRVAQTPFWHGFAGSSFRNSPKYYPACRCPKNTPVATRSYHISSPGTANSPRSSLKIWRLEFRQRHHNGEVSSNSRCHDLGINVIDFSFDPSMGHMVPLSREYDCELFRRFVPLIWSGNGGYNIRLRTISGNSTHPEAVRDHFTLDGPPLPTRYGISM